MNKDITNQGTGQNKAIGLQSGAKSLIRNVIRHTDSHNRLLEESEMWQLYYKMKSANPNDKDNDKEKVCKVDKSKDGKESNNGARRMGFRDPDIHSSFLYDERKDMRWEGSSRQGMKRAHMDDSSDEDRNVSTSSKSTFWMRQLYKAEEADPDRWGHAGFKELYPDDFNSDRSASSDCSSGEKLKKKKHIKKRHKHKSVAKKKKQKNSDSEKKKKKKEKAVDMTGQKKKGKLNKEN